VTTNNSYVFALDAGPNLMVTPLTLWQEPVIGNVIKTNVITAIVANIGPLPAQNVEVHVFANAQSGFGRLLFTRTISVLQPGATVVIEGEGSGALPCGVKVQVDPRWQSGELTRSSQHRAAARPRSTYRLYGANLAQGNLERTNAYDEAAL
jgi:hypothetical protein